jgi:hypothetical protein
MEGGPFDAAGPAGKTDPRAAPVVVLAVAVAAVDADRPAVAVGGDNGVHPVGLADAAEILNRFAGAVASWVHVGCYDRTDSGDAQ